MKEVLMESKQRWKIRERARIRRKTVLEKEEKKRREKQLQCGQTVAEQL
jgi:hypothetical protein